MQPTSSTNGVVEQWLMSTTLSQNHQGPSPWRKQTQIAGSRSDFNNLCLFTVADSRTDIPFLLQRSCAVLEEPALCLSCPTKASREKWSFPNSQRYLTSLSVSLIWEMGVDVLSILSINGPIYRSSFRNPVSFLIKYEAILTWFCEIFGFCCSAH